MNPAVVASLWWSLLAASVVLTFIALALASWRLALFAALCSLAFAIAALASIGAFILLLTGFQLLLAYLLHRRGGAGRHPVS